MLSYFPHIQAPDFTGDLKSDVKALLFANNKPKTFDHCRAVAEKCAEIAVQYGLDTEICELSGYLHDISAILSHNDMMKYAIDSEWYIYEAEKRVPMLLHQRISRVLAQEVFGITDERILSAVECHTTLKSAPSEYDMALFVADKLAWDGDGEAPFYSVVNYALEQSLRAAALAYMDYIVEHKIILYPHDWFEDGVKFLLG